MDNIQKIIENVDIVDEVSKYIDLQQSGSNYTAVCPFHADTNPSLTVNREKKIFKCFVCGTGGNVVNFVKEFEKIPLQKAIEKISTEHNLEISLREKKVIQYSEKHYLLKDVFSYYKSMLHLLKDSDPLQKYINTRNIDSSIIEQFNLGFSNGQSEKLKIYLEKRIETEKKYSFDAIHELRILTQNNYEFFANRLVIPIFDEDSRVVGFSGRIIDGNSTNAPKYLNSADSDVFEKGKILYNYNFVKENNPEEIIITEGFFDVFKLYEIGEENVVASMGTALTPNHLKLLKNLPLKRIYLGFDNDNAGNLTTLKLGRILLTETNLNITVLDLLEQKDIDEYIEHYNLSSVDSLKKKSITFKEFEINTLLKENPLDSIELKTKFLKAICRNLNKLGEIEKGIILEKISELTDVNIEIIKNTYITKSAPVQINPIKKSGHSQQNGRVVISTNEMLIIHKIYNHKNLFIETYDNIRATNMVFNDFKRSLEDLHEFYQSFSEWDFISFTDRYPDTSKVIEMINQKEGIKISTLSLEEILEIQVNKTVKSWKIFKTIKEKL